MKKAIKFGSAYLVGILAAAASVLPHAAFAHEKWFVGSLPVNTPKPLLFSTFNGTNMSLTAAALLGIIAAVFLHRAFRTHHLTLRAREFFTAHKKHISPLLMRLTGLLLFAGSFGRFLFELDLSTMTLTPGLERTLLALQLFIALGLVIGIYPRIMSILGLALFVASALFFPLVSILPYIFFIGIFLYLIFEKHRPATPIALRIFGGLSFIFSALLFKLLDPAYALEFLRLHPTINFLPSADIFIFVCGLAEFSLGVLMILGVLPRLVGGFVLLLFAGMIAQLGIFELLGHLPLIAFAFALVADDH